MQTFKIIACSNIPIKEDWPQQLVTLLGSKPRRLSRWCELGLFGALSCLSQTQHTLSNQVAIRVYSELATMNVTLQAIAQAREHLPMPFTFMQTQSGQLFNALGSALNWHGDGAIVAANTRQHAEAMLLQESSVLLAWVDEMPVEVSSWLWLQAVDVGEIGDVQWQPLASVFQAAPSARCIKIDAAQRLWQGC